MKSLLLAAALVMMPLAACAQTPASTPADHGHAHADFESGRFHVRVEGEGRDIILIPGLTSHPDIWEPLVARLEGDWRVHMIHIQGFAGAPAMDNIDGPVSAPVAAMRPSTRSASASSGASAPESDSASASTGSPTSVATGCCWARCGSWTSAPRR